MAGMKGKSGGARRGAGRKPSAVRAVRALEPRDQLDFLAALFDRARRGNVAAIRLFLQLGDEPENEGPTQ